MRKRKHPKHRSIASLSAANKASLRRKWRSWSLSLARDLGELFRKKEIYWGLNDVARANPAVLEPGAFFDWASSNYAVTVSLGIRRLADPDSRSISIGRLLWELAEYSDLLTRKANCALYRGVPVDLAERTFDNIAGKNRQVVSFRAIRADFAEVQRASRRIKRVVDKRFAHRAHPRAIRRVPTYQEIDDALATFDEILFRYVILLTARGLSTTRATPQYNWQEVLVEPWIPRDSTLRTPGM